MINGRNIWLKINKLFSVILENEEKRPPKEFEPTKNLSSDSAERTFFSSYNNYTRQYNSDCQCYLTKVCNTYIKYVYFDPLNQKIFKFSIANLQILRAQNVNWTYIRRSVVFLDVFWTSYVRSIYVLCLQAMIRNMSCLFENNYFQETFIQACQNANYILSVFLKTYLDYLPKIKVKTLIWLLVTSNILKVQTFRSFRKRGLL